jgi:outer membrane beta-barrel protein
MTRALASLATLVLAAAPAATAAKEAADAFGQRIPPVSGRLYSKAGKLEITPTANLSLNDAFFSKYFFGGKVGWHATETWSFSGSITTGFARATGSTAVCPRNEGCQSATDAQLTQVPGELRTMVGAEIGFSPVYGKLNAFAEKVIHFDLSFLLGADWIRYRGVQSATDANAGADPGVQSTFGAHVGLGTRVFLGRTTALRIEVKDYLYRAPVLGSNTIQNQLFTEIGLSFFLPSLHQGR